MRKNILQIEAELKSCPCGGRLMVSPAVRMSPRKNSDKETLVHITIKCEKCGAWRGGFTAKSKWGRGNDKVASVWLK